VCLFLSRAVSNGAETLFQATPIRPARKCSLALWRYLEPEPDRELYSYSECSYPEFIETECSYPEYIETECPYQVYPEPAYIEPEYINPVSVQEGSYLKSSGRNKTPHKPYDTGSQSTAPLSSTPGSPHSSSHNEQEDSSDATSESPNDKEPFWLEHPPDSTHPTTQLTMPEKLLLDAVLDRFYRCNTSLVFVRDGAVKRS